jgi:hypothetical protein
MLPRDHFVSRFKYKKQQPGIQIINEIYNIQDILKLKDKIKSNKEELLYFIMVIIVGL